MITRVSNFNLKPFNTFGMDVNCREWIEFTSADDLPALIQNIADEPFMMIGGGSNMLFMGDYAGIILHSRILDAEMSTAADGVTQLLRAGSGIILDDLISSCTANRLWGLENLSGIPGEVGASAVQNVGAYGVEAKDVILSVECYDVIDRRFVTFDVKDCDYGYRHSMFKLAENKGRYIVTYVTFELKTDSKPQLQYGNLQSMISDSSDVTPGDVRAAVMDLRSKKLPDVTNFGSAGSFFKNPIVTQAVYRNICSLVLADGVTAVPHYDVEQMVKIPAAWLIEQCGLKGFVMGNAAIWHLQPLVIVNTNGKASPMEIVALERHVIDKVYTKFGIKLVPEVEHIEGIA